MARFDWYASSLPGAQPDHVIGELLGTYDLVSVEQSKGMYGYRYGADIRRGSRTLARVWWGGNGGHVHAVATGEDAPPLAAKVREVWPEHYVTRVDSAEDFEDSEAWDACFALSLAVAEAHRLDVRHFGDYFRAEKGRTLYIGSPSAIAQVRVYEKGIQLGTSPDHVRVEVSARPKKRDARLALAQATPDQVWGVSGWTQDLWHRLGMSAIPRIVAGTVYRPEDDDRAWSWMLRQYGALLSRKAAHLGGWCSLGELIGECLQALDDRSKT